MNPLDQLRDIHLPDAIQWWPLAIGWWIVAALLLASIVGFWTMRNKNKKQRLLMNHAMDSLEQLEADTELNTEEWLQSLSALLRRIVINLHGRKATAGLVGEPWLEYLDSHAKSKNFTEGEGRLLATQPYQAMSKYDRKVLSGLVRNWVKSQTNHSRASTSVVTPAVIPAKSKVGANHA